MARDEITIQLPVIANTATYDVAGLEVTEQTVTVANGIKLKDAFSCMRNTLVITVKNTADADKTVTFKAGNAYPNAMRGDFVAAVGTSTVNEFRVQDPSRFVNKDGTMLIDFSTGFTGTIYATGKPTGVGQGVEQ